MRRFPTRNDGPLQSNNCFKDAGPVLRERRFGLGGSVPAAERAFARSVRSYAARSFSSALGPPEVVGRICDSLRSCSCASPAGFGLKVRQFQELEQGN